MKDKFQELSYLESLNIMALKKLITRLKKDDRYQYTIFQNWANFEIEKIQLVIDFKTE